MQNLYLEQTIILIIIVVVSIVTYLTDKGEHAALYKTNQTCIPKTSKIKHKHNVVFLTSETKTDIRRRKSLKVEY